MTEFILVYVRKLTNIIKLEKYLSRDKCLLNLTILSHELHPHITPKIHQSQYRWISVLL